MEWNIVSEVGHPTKSGYYLTSSEDKTTFMHYWNNGRGQKCWYSLRTTEDGDAIKIGNDYVKAWASLPKRP